MIPTWNGLALLRRFLPSVLTAANRYARVYGARVEVLIVDDGSSDDSRQWLLDYGFADSSALTPRKQAGALPQVAESHLPTKPGELPITLKLVTSEVNRGFGETCNRGIAAASQPLVFLLNNDVEVDEDAIAPLVENFKDELVFAAHCRVFDLETGREVGVGKVGGFSRG
ncbi:MAG TPA: glycosyltransferase, partial [Blastocatellia bacterium]|nr:glycosyltransferase [Blastocatellia bacterium]